MTNAADGLDPKNRASITSLIDTKIESDMKEAITMMRGEFSSIRSEFGSIRNEIASLKTELVHVEDRYASQFKHVDNKFATVYWVIGLAVGLSTALLATLIALIPLLKH